MDHTVNNTLYSSIHCIKFLIINLNSNFLRCITHEAINVFFKLIEKLKHYHLNSDDMHAEVFRGKYIGRGKESYIDGWKNGLTSIVKMSEHILGHLL